MLDHSSTHSSLAVVSGFRVALFAAGALWTAYQVLPGFYRGEPHISAYGDHSPLHFPESHKLELITSAGERVEIQSIWKFNLKNNGNEPAKGIALELPFGGFYRIEQPGKTEEVRVTDFQKTIKIDALSPAKEVAVTVWTGQPADEGVERQTKVTAADGQVAIDYPVKVNGLLAWVERSKGLIMVMLAMACLLFLL